MSPERRRSFPALALGLLLVAGLIKLAGIIKGDALVFPGVTDILRAFFELLRTPATWVRVSVTLWDLLRALLVSAALGIGLGVFEALSPFVRTLLQPLTHLLRALPMIVLVIAVMVLSPYRHVPPIACVLVLTPLITESIYEGITGIDPDLIDACRLDGGLGFTVLTRVYLPLIGGYLRQSAANAVGTGFKLVVTAEYLVQTRDSLGKALFSSAYFSDYAQVYAYALLMALIALMICSAPSFLMFVLTNRQPPRYNTPVD